MEVVIFDELGNNEVEYDKNQNLLVINDSFGQKWYIKMDHFEGFSFHTEVVPFESDHDTVRKYIEYVKIFCKSEITIELTEFKYNACKDQEEWKRSLDSFRKFKQNFTRFLLNLL